VDGLEFDFSEYAHMYRGEAAERQSPVRPQSDNLTHKEGNLLHGTTHKEDFKEWPLQRSGPVVRPEEIVYVSEYPSIRTV